MFLLAACGLLAAAEDGPDGPRQPDRPAPVPLGFRPLPEIERQEEALVVEGFRLLPLADLGVDGRAWELHPKALVGIAWDDNPLQAETGSDGDVQERLALGFEARAQGRDGWRADVGGMLRLQRYENTSGRDFTGGDALARVQRLGETMRVTALTTWEQTSEPLIDIPEQVERANTLASLAATGESRGSRWSGRLAWSDLDYLEASRYFDSAERDQERWSASGSCSLVGAAESLLGVEAATDLVLRPASSTANDFTAIAIQGRWRHALGGRSALDLRLGATVRQHADDSAGLAANDDRTVAAPTGQATLHWGWETYSYAMLSLSSALVDGVSAEANAAQRLALEFTAHVRLRDRLDLVSTGWLSRREDSSPAGSQVTEVAHDTHLRLGLDYRLREGLGLRSWAAWQDRRSSTASDYDRLLVALELVAAL